MWKHVLIGFLLSFGLAAGARAQQKAAPAATGEDITVITSEKLTFDYQKQFALFEENVVVVDPQMKILADKMTVIFDQGNKAKSIKAEGKVYIIQDDRKARADLATYDVPTGKITLTGSPQVTRGQDMLTAETIVFWRDDNRMECYPRVRMVIYPGSGGARGELLGGGKGSGGNQRK